MISNHTNIKRGLIKEIKVESLFGLFNYDIPLNDSGVTILIGINGSGKSTIFKMLDSVLNLKFFNILDIDFETFEVTFHNGESIKCEKFTQEKNVTDFSLNIVDKKGLESDVIFRSSLSKLWNRQKILKDYRITVESSDSASSFTHSLVKVTEQNEKNAIAYRSIELSGQQKEVLQNLRKNTRFIETQRLQVIDFDFNNLKNDRINRYIVRKSPEGLFEEFNMPVGRSRIEEYANELSKIIKSKRSDYFSVSQDVEKNTLNDYLDSNFDIRGGIYRNEIKNIKTATFQMEEHIKKLLDLGIYEPEEMSVIMDSKKLNQKLNELIKFEERFENYQNQDGIPKEDTTKDDTNLGNNKNFGDDSDDELEGFSDLLNFAIKSSLLKVYADNMKRKLDIFEGLESKIETFKTNINNLFIHKVMKVDLEKGFIFELKDGQDKQRTIDPKDLSSGEQHEVILNYELIFKTQQDSVILIDEPEISLHVLWQKKFITNLLEIAKANNLNILVATHSPDIVHKHRDLVVQLNAIS